MPDIYIILRKPLVGEDSFLMDEDDISVNFSLHRVNKPSLVNFVTKSEKL